MHMVLTVCLNQCEKFAHIDPRGDEKASRNKLEDKQPQTGSRIQALRGTPDELKRSVESPEHT